jgi:hypothetical protein
MPAAAKSPIASFLMEISLLPLSGERYTRAAVPKKIFAISWNRLESRAEFHF